MQPSFHLIKNYYNITIKRRALCFWHDLLKIVHYTLHRIKLTHLVISKEGDVAWVGDCQDLPVPKQGGPGLEQTREHVKLKVGDVIVAREVDSGLQGHGLQAWADGVDLVQGESEHLPRNDCPFTETSPPEVGRITFGYPECITGEKALGENGLEFTEHVAKH